MAGTAAKMESPRSAHMKIQSHLQRQAWMRSVESSGGLSHDGGIYWYAPFVRGELALFLTLYSLRRRTLRGYAQL